jgi:1-aminocyclopropane-1-carboxylate deaminase/D-cysteine desulfhydrase-like pyridoxal-dependent ACC family enzyme
VVTETIDVAGLRDQNGQEITDAGVSPVVVSPTDLTPWENRNGRWYKREDLHRNKYGVNGAKYRVARHLMTQAVLDGYDTVVSAQSVLSPQSPIVATLAEEMGLECILVYGASKPETVVKHRNVAIAVEAGAMVDTSPRVAYNPVIQPYGARLAEELGAWQMPYAISPELGGSQRALQEFLEVGGRQTLHMPEQIETLVIAFGSGNTTAGVLYGLSRFAEHVPKRVVLVGVGPDRTKWLGDRLEQAGVDTLDFWENIELQHIPLHGWFANYSDKMPETVDGIEMHPTYEGKVIRYLNESNLDWWHNRDGSVGFWIVGGPL